MPRTRSARDCHLRTRCVGRKPSKALTRQSICALHDRSGRPSLHAAFSVPTPSKRPNLSPHHPTAYSQLVCCKCSLHSRLPTSIHPPIYTCSYGSVVRVKYNHRPIRRGPRGTWSPFGMDTTCALLLPSMTTGRAPSLVFVCKRSGLVLAHPTTPRATGKTYP